MEAPGPLVGQGRTADVFDCGDGKVLRRYRKARDTEREVAAMEHARKHGYPAPRAEALSPTDIVMDRIPGLTMLSHVARRPWLIGRHARTLAELHDRLHAIPALRSLASPLGDGDALLHLDLHPDNVIISPAGPIVIDWPNAALGPPAADVAHTLIVLTCAAPTGGHLQQAISGFGRGLFKELFLKRFDRPKVEAHIPAAARYRLATRELPGPERRAVEQLAATATTY